MKKTLLPVLAMSLLLVSAASAGVLLGWGDSPTNGAPTSLVYDCQSNGGTSTLVVSLVPPVDVSGVTGFVVDLRTWDSSAFCDGGPCRIQPLPPYWYLGAGGCRAGAISMSGGFAGVPMMDPSPVVDPWQGGLDIVLPHAWQIVTFLEWYPPLGVNDTVTYATCGLEGMLPAGTSVDLLAGHEYYMATFTIRHSKSAMPGGCDGCCKPVGFIPSVRLVVSPASGVVYSISNYGFWQGYAGPTCSVVPARTSTWGALKSAYR